MYQKLKNTLAGLTVALSLLGMSYTVGRPPRMPVDPASFAAPGYGAQADSGDALRRSRAGLKRQLSMPFFSFAPLLPRRES